MLQKITHYYLIFLKQLPSFDGIPALMLRVYLAPVFIIAGYNKLGLPDPDITGLTSLLANPNIVEWFGNAEWGLGLPFPALLANLAAWSEFLGGWFLLFGLLTRLVSIPLMVTMVIAMTTVHADNGWFAITPTNPDTSPAKVVSWLGFEQGDISMQNSNETAARLGKMRDLLEENGNTEWLYDKGPIVVLNNGIEFAMTYFIMLLVLVFMGGGRFTSADYYLSRALCSRCKKQLEQL
ncbi:MAG: quinol oxidase [Gammaproteobacteria bacterium]|nr:MAG: quinol oxidase [Gammaproteobacteria bacterium]